MAGKRDEHKFGSETMCNGEYSSLTALPLIKSSQGKILILIPVELLPDAVNFLNGAHEFRGTAVDCSRQSCIVQVPSLQ